MVHFKGCPLRCKWCSTPESQETADEIGLNPNRCIGCGACVPVCKSGALHMGHDGKAALDWSKCSTCFDCLKECYAGALKRYGTEVAPDALALDICKDMPFFRNSGGGVTFSGGEPLMHVDDEMIALYRRVKEAGITIGVDTTGCVPWEHIERLAPFIDFFLWDIKHMDPEKHKELTNVSNELILANLRRVDEETDIDLYIRLPLIPGMTLSEENIQQTCEFVKSLKHLVRLDLLPFHHMGKKRYLFSGKQYLMDDQELIDDQLLENALNLVKTNGIPCSIVR